jgi:mevalonate kinase
MKNFRANGKLLLTAEYSVLRGALALAVPTRFGQTLAVYDSKQDLLTWNSLDHKNQTWFKAQFSKELDILSTTDITTATTLQNILRTSIQLNPAFQPTGVAVKTKLEFNRHWGLGSSSTLIALVAQWAKVDALDLFFKTLSGSGYDVACATVDHPITYQKNTTEVYVHGANFNPAFKHDIHFIYLGQKQKSDAEVARFSSREVDNGFIEHISKITEQVIQSAKLQNFEELLAEHENITSKLIGMTPIQHKLFSDYPGIVKSLGAWGGDFVLVTRLAQSPNYFPSKGFNTILSWDEMIGT